MPQINKVRIIDFSYNNHKRRIVDETFDFYNGENALLNLTNGGGKSVLVQLMLQPLLPKTRLMNRRIEDFFKGKKSPSYILIEWKLEDKGGYLLTGIALANRESQARENEDSVNHIKYYTFTSHYKKENPLDIVNIPLVRQSGTKLYIEDFKEARKILAAKGAVDLFNDDEGISYQAHLESFNIFPDEWKTIVLKINESEGGVIDIFEKCKTSLQLMNDWILKTIEKVVHKDESDQQKLEQMFVNLIQEMIDNEQYLNEKKIYEEFLIESEKFLGKLEELLESLDEENQQVHRLTAMYLFLEQQISMLSEGMEYQKSLIVAAENEIGRIELEERSKDYHDKAEEFRELKIQLQNETNVLVGIDSDITDNEQQITIQEAAKLYRNLLTIQGRIGGIQTEIRKIESDSDNKEEMESLAYSLKLGYEKLMEDLTTSITDIETKMRSAGESVKLCKKEIEEIDQRSSKLNKESGKLNFKIEQFQEQEASIQQDLDFVYERNLLGEIEESYFSHYFQSKEEERVQFEEKKQFFLESEQSLNMIVEQTETRLKKARIEENNLNLKIAEQVDKIKAYNSLEAELELIFVRYGLDIKKRFRHEENEAFMQRKINELEQGQRDQELQIHTVSEMLSSLEEGALHVSAEFRQWLLNEGIDFETGERYLQNQSEAIRNDLIQHNPLLPFAFLLHEAELEQVKTMKFGLHIRQLVPLLTYSDVNARYTSNGHVVSLRSASNAVLI